jgi:aconitate hydratase
MNNTFRARSTLKVGDQSYEIWSLAALPQEKIARLPYSLKVLLENLLRHEDGVNVTRADIEALLAWDPAATPSHEIAFTCDSSGFHRGSVRGRPCGHARCHRASRR